LAAVADEVDEPVLGIHLHNPAGPPVARGDRVLERAVAAVAVEVAPAAALRPPDHLVVLLDVARGLHVQERRFERLPEDAPAPGPVHGDGALFEVALEPVAADEPQLTRALPPAEVAVPLVLPVRRDLDERLRLGVEVV